MTVCLRYYATGIALLIVFFFVRVLPIPLFVCGLLRPSSYFNCTWFQTVIILLTCPIPFLLNAFWYKLMVRKCIRIIENEIAARYRAVSMKSNLGTKKTPDVADQTKLETQTTDDDDQKDPTTDDADQTESKKKA